MVDVVGRAERRIAVGTAIVLSGTNHLDFGTGVSADSATHASYSISVLTRNRIRMRFSPSLLSVSQALSV
jgi:hypothetical protein